MKILVVALCTSLFVFALSSAWSDMLQPQGSALVPTSLAQNSVVATDRPSRRIARPAVAPSDDDESPAPTRVTAKPLRTASRLHAETSAASEHLETSTVTMREQMTEVKQREAQLIARQETLRLICDDIHAELALVKATRREADNALIAAEQRVVNVAQRVPRFDGNDQREGSRQQPPALDSDETAPPATDSPAVRTTVLLIRRLVVQGSADTATSLLSRMKQREAAKVLAALHRDDPRMAAHLMSSLSAATDPNRQD